MDFKHFAIATIIKWMQRRFPKKVNVLGRDYIVSENVFNPKYFFTSELIASVMDAEGKDVLDVGCGSGVLAIEAAAQNARMVVATDINGEAVEIARKNAIRNGLFNIIFIQCDLFSCLDKKFDIIVFNPPYLEGKIKKPIDRAIFDPGKKLVERFLKEAGDYLKDDGYVLLAYSTIADINKMLAIANKFEWKYETIKTKKLQFEKIFVFKMLKIYKPQPL